MSLRNYQLYLEDIQVACKKILIYTAGMTLEQFKNNEMAYDAVMRNLEILGEAVKNIPEDVRQQHTQIEWRKMAGLRDIVIHRYFGINNELIWDVITNKLEPLLRQVEQILEQN